MKISILVLTTVLGLTFGASSFAGMNWHGHDHTPGHHRNLRKGCGKHDLSDSEKRRCKRERRRESRERRRELRNKVHACFVYDSKGELFKFTKKGGSAYWVQQEALKLCREESQVPRSCAPAGCRRVN